MARLIDGYIQLESRKGGNYSGFYPGVFSIVYMSLSQDRKKKIK